MTVFVEVPLAVLEAEIASAKRLKKEVKGESEESHHQRQLLENIVKTLEWVRDGRVAEKPTEWYMNANL